jgi:hypothetical protein
MKLKRLWLCLAVVGIAAGATVSSGVASFAGPTLLGIDGAPPFGTGGWYSTGGGSITSTYPGSPVTLIVTALQPGPEYADGTFTVTYNPSDFSYLGNNDTSATCVPSTGSVTCSYTDLAHSAKSDGFNFTALGPDTHAVVTATVVVNGFKTAQVFSLPIEPALTIDTPPPSGSGGWYATGGGPITRTTKGSPVTLIVTALQPATEYSNGTFTVTYNPSDFSYLGNNDTSASCVTSTGSATCSYTDLGHSAKSDGFNFTALGPDSHASVTATVTINGYTASEVFVLSIQP